jgi:hypothetical protein
MEQLSEYATLVVRLFPDYGESPIWFAIGYVTYERAQLSEALESDLREWDESFYRDHDDHSRWNTPQAGEVFVQRGLELAERLSVELGDTFVVEADTDVRGHRKKRFRSTRAPTNSKASESFRARSDRVVAQLARVQKLTAQGHSFGWTAHAPESDVDYEQPGR